MLLKGMRLAARAKVTARMSLRGIEFQDESIEDKPRFNETEA